jgi:hypothetical protein
MTEAAPEMGEHFWWIWETLDPLVTPARAERIRQWRAGMDASWLKVGQMAAALWPETAGPGVELELIGLALCHSAAHYFGENFMTEPWN